MDIQDFYTSVDHVIEDSPKFAEKFLVPAVESGFHLALISPFVPSYAFDLLQSLGTGKFSSPSVTLTVVIQRGVQDIEISDLIDVAMSRYLDESHTLGDLKKLLADLIRRNCLDLQFIFSSPGKELSSTCKGMLVAGSPLDRRYIAFHDEIPGDYNSPISLLPSWNLEFTEFARRIQDLQYIIQLNATKNSTEQTKKYIATLLSDFKPKPVKKAKTQIHNDELDDDDFIDSFDDDDYIDLEVPKLTQWLSDSYTHAPNVFHDDTELLEAYIFGNFDESADFWDGEEFDLDTYFVSTIENAHVGAVEDMDEDVSCWCGRTFAAYKGCPEAF
jgi:hypothetical protein